MKLMLKVIVALILINGVANAEDKTKHKAESKTDESGSDNSKIGTVSTSEKNVGSLNFDKITNNFGQMLGGSGKVINNNTPDAEKTSDNLGDGIEKAGDEVTGK